MERKPFWTRQHIKNVAALHDRQRYLKELKERCTVKERETQMENEDVWDIWQDIGGEG